MFRTAKNHFGGASSASVVFPSRCSLSRKRVIQPVSVFRQFKKTVFGSYVKPSKSVVSRASWKLLSKLKNVAPINAETKTLLATPRKSRPPAEAKARHIQSLNEISCHWMQWGTVVDAAQQVHICQHRPRCQVNDIRGQGNLPKQ